jgi:sarcosine oxidase subunit gamma
MPLDLSATIEGPLDDVAASARGVRITSLPPATRLVLRGRPGAIEAAAGAFGAPMPHEACRAATATDGRAALWLGPDEWLLLAHQTEGKALAAVLEAAMDAQPHSVVDVSQRQTGVEISGDLAAAVLNAGCPLDLDLEAFPVGMCTRTVFAKAEIVLWRTGPATFHIEVWRSFAAYIWGLLEEASREFRT